MTTGLTDTLLAGRYRLRALLGRGGMAEVYDGFDERLHRDVAVKVLRPPMASHPQVRTRFEAEARNAARLSHPNVVAVYDTGDQDGVPFLVMERLPGETLADRITNPPVDPGWLLQVAGDVLSALQAAHAAGIVHRDVKPANILLATDGRAKVADFGIAKSAEVAAADLTGTNQLVGTPAYLAPERLQGQPATPQADLYALGVLLYEALAGQKPFNGPTPVAMAYAITHEAPVPLATVRPDLTPALAGLIDRAMARQPEGRYASASEMAAALERCPEAKAARVTDRRMPAVAPAVDPTVVLPVGQSRPPLLVFLARWRHLLAPALVALFGVLALVGLVAAGRSQPSEPTARLAAQLRDDAGDLDIADGPAHEEARARLETLAEAVEAGGGADESNVLLGQLAAWKESGQLTASATERLRVLVSRVPGADPAAFTPPTTAPPVTEAPPPPQGDGDGDKEEEADKGGGKGKKGKGDD